MKYFDAVLEILINVYLWLCIFFAVFYCVNAAFGAEVKIPQNAFKYREYLIKESRFVWGIEAPSATFAAQIHTESGWNEKAKSPAGAVYTDANHPAANIGSEGFFAKFPGINAFCRGFVSFFNDRADPSDAKSQTYKIGRASCRERV